MRMNMEACCKKDLVVWPSNSGVFAFIGETDLGFGDDVRNPTDDDNKDGQKVEGETCEYGHRLEHARISGVIEMS